MWPLISSARIASACSAASSGESANFTPPAFIRPPVSTWDLIDGRPADLLGHAARLAGGGREAVGRDRDPGLGDDLPGFVFEEPHGRAEPYPGRPCASSSASSLLLLLPSTASAAEITFEFDSAPGVRFGSAHTVEGKLTQDGAPLAGQAVSIERARRIPFRDGFAPAGDA